MIKMLAERFERLRGAVKSAASSLDPRSFAASFVLLAGLSVLASYSLISASPPLTQEAHPALGLNTGKIVAHLDISQHQDQPIQYGVPTPATEEHGQENGEMTPSPLHTEDTTGLPVPSIKETEAIDGLFEDTPFGPVPVKRAADNMTVFQAYKMPFTPIAGAKGVIAIVMVDYGLSESLSKQAIYNLPSGVSFALSPYAADFQHKIDQARSTGHEIWMQIPIQSKAFGAEDDTGPLTLLSGLNSEQNNIRMLRSLSLGRGYVGVLFNNMPYFEESPDELKDILSVITARGLALTESVADDKKTIALANEVSLPYTSSSFWIEGDQGDAALRKSLDDLEQEAAQNYLVVAFMRPQPKLFPVLQEWGTSLSDKGLQLAPLSVIVEKRK